MLILTFLLVFVGSGVAVWLIWGTSIRRSMKQGRSAQASKSVPLTRHEKKLKKQAKKLWQAKKYQAAAQMLESIGLVKNAVSMLEEQGLIQEAGKILLRNGFHETAGVIFARHKIWEQAATCFEKAEKDLEAAQCYREAEKFIKAAELFSKLKNYHAEAQCYQDGGELQKAGEAYIKLKKLGNAIPLYNELHKQDPKSFLRLKFSVEEIKAFTTWVKADKNDWHFVEVLGRRKKLKSILLDLTKEGKKDLAAAVYARGQKAREDTSLGPALVAEVSYESRQAKTMASVLLRAEAFEFAGMIYEKLEKFREAAEAYEKSGNSARAEMCFQRAGGERSGGVKAAASDSQSALEPAHTGDDELSDQKGPESETGEKPNIESPVPPPPEMPPRTPPKPAPEKGMFSLGEVSEVYIPGVHNQALEQQDEKSVEEEKNEVTTDDSGDENGGEDDSLNELKSGELNLDVGENFQLHGPAEEVTMVTGEFAVTGPLENTAIDYTLNLSILPDELTDAQKEPFFECKLFKGLTQKQKVSLLSHSVLEELMADDELTLEGGVNAGIYIVLRGSLGNTSKETVHLEKNCESGDSLGEAFVFSDYNIPEVFLAKQDTLISRIGVDFIRQLFRDDPLMARQLYKNYTSGLLERLRASDKTVNIQDDS